MKLLLLMVFILKGIANNIICFKEYGYCYLFGKVIEININNGIYFKKLANSIILF